MFDHDHLQYLMNFNTLHFFKPLLLVCCVGMNSSTSRLLAEDFYVDPSGSNKSAQSGSAESPFSSIQQAQQAVRKLTAAGLTESARVFLADGDYFLSQPIEFGPQDGGSGGFTVSYIGSDHTRIVGSEALKDWELMEDGKWRTRLDVQSLKSLTSLWVEGVAQPKARHPNSGFLRLDQVIDNRRSFTFSAEDVIPGVANPSNVLLGLLHDWSMTYVPLQTLDLDKRLIVSEEIIGGPYEFWRIDGFEAQPRFFLENAPEFIDQPGEWSFDPSNGDLIYLPRAGECMESFEAKISQVSQLIKIEGKPDQPVQNLIFKNLKFEETEWSPVGNRYAGGQAGFFWPGGERINEGGWKTMPPAISVSDAEDVHFQSCVFNNLSGSGIWLAKRSDHCSITDSQFTNIQCNAILLGEENPDPSQPSGRHTVSHNLIEHSGSRYFGAVGIWIGLSPGNRVTHNEIRNLPYTGISVGWAWSPETTVCGENRIEHNHIHHIMQILSDGGGIYVLGRQPGTVLAANHIHDIPLNFGRAESNGMFLDQGAMEIVVERNLIYGTDRSPLRFHLAEKNFVRENVLVLPEETPAVRFNSTPEANIILENNTLIPASEWSEEQLKKWESRISDFPSRAILSP